jgi:hypothetical protein
LEQRAGRRRCRPAFFGDVTLLSVSFGVAFFQRRCRDVRAFSGEVDTGSREENA